MKPTTASLLLLAGTPLSLAAPARDQVVLGHDNNSIPTSTRATTTLTSFTTVPTITTTRPRTRTTPTPLWMMTTRTRPHTKAAPASTPAPTSTSTSTPTPAPEPIGKAVWDWLFHPQPPNRSVRPKGEGCFCAGGSTCCYRPNEEIVCGLGTC
ncbi:hypothetical protein QBC39DRAFT_373653 [Podospora conica]|nr:hypothetical protein QBC39DRAFT_373653 [Schizothecium conicum]